MPGDLLNPQLDVVFKLLFTRNQQLLVAMLEAVLGEPIGGVTVLNPTLPGDLSVDKIIALDILAELLDDRRVDVEMQIHVTDEMAPRLLYYGAREYAGQLARGDDYDQLRPTVVVAWLAQPLIAELHQLHSIFELRERRTGKLFSDHLSFHLLQLTEITQETPNPQSPYERNLQLWARFLTARTREEFSTLARENETMSQAMEALEKLSESPEARRLAREREDSLKLYNMSLAQSEHRGREEGREEGRHESLRVAIVRLCNAFDIQLTPLRQARLDDHTTDLQALFDSILDQRRWPEERNPLSR